MITLQDLARIAEYVWEIPQSYRDDMRVPARIYASKALPPTLIPYIGLESFPYGILEIRHLGMGWKLIPRRVKKMK